MGHQFQSLEFRSFRLWRLHCQSHFDVFNSESLISDCRFWSRWFWISILHSLFSCIWESSIQSSVQGLRKPSFSHWNGPKAISYGSGLTEILFCIPCGIWIAWGSKKRKSKVFPANHKLELLLYKMPSSWALMEMWWVLALSWARRPIYPTVRQINFKSLPL